MKIQLKRAYVPAEPSDGFRILVDRLWPRGIKKEDLAYDVWEKSLAPSTELRQWFGHDPAKYSEFKTRYITELAENSRLAELLSVTKNHPTVTLIYSAKDEQHNQAVVMKDYLESL